MGTNQLLPFANGDTPNVLDYASWNSLAARLTGFQSGIASSQQFNYILSQGGAAGYTIGQLVADYAQQDATLNATALYAAFKQALAAFVPSGIADGSIVTAKLADDAVTSAKLAAGAVNNAAIASQAVGTSNIQPNAITSALIASAAVGSAQIAPSAVAFTNLQSGAIATQAQAEAGTDNTVLMTPLRVAQAIKDQVSAGNPSGTIIAFAGSTVPEGYLLCNGANVSRTTYANLFAAIGTAWGSGDGSTTFTLPNFSGRFLEGTTSAGSVGDYLSAGLPNITGSFTPWGFRSSLNPSGAFTQAGTSEHSYDAADNERGSYISFSASRYNSIYGRSTTVQPSSGSVYFCIKI
ncbi:phage tail protein [Sutterella wadsworthensis]|uniref:phage tail protein n=1 Tax=Sutterella wadsworthensis TaxID=40545 RepID=UPI003AEF523E